MLKTIHLHGSLAEKFQPTYSLDVETPAEALRAIMVQVPGFEQEIRKGEFVCVRGNAETGVECDEELLHLRLGNVKDFHIIPAVTGAGRGGGKILLGIALIGATLISGGAALAAAGSLGAGLGVSGTIGAAWGGGLIGAIGGISGLGMYVAGAGALLVLGGAAQAISTMATSSADLTSVDSKAGYLFNGAFNSSQQGSAVPLVFGRIRAGTVVVSAGITAERTSESVADNYSISTSVGNMTFNLS